MVAAAPIPDAELERPLSHFGIRHDAADVPGNTAQRRNHYTADGCIGQLNVPETINLARLLNRVSGTAQAKTVRALKDLLYALEPLEHDDDFGAARNGGPDPDAPRRAYWQLPAVKAAQAAITADEPVDPRDSDPARAGLFQTHNCARCGSGARPCVNRSPSRCDQLLARND